jgi:hypothetical protein
MNPQKFEAFFAQHKAAVLGVAAAGVAGLALIQRKKNAGSGGGSIEGTIPAAAVVQGSTPGTGGGSYDSTAYDVYSAIQPQLEALMQTQGKGVAAAPKPIASSIFAPSNTGKVLSYGDGRAYELEKDGSLFGLTTQQLHQLQATNKKLVVTKVAGSATRPTGTGFFNTKTNVARAAKQY